MGVGQMLEGDPIAGADVEVAREPESSSKGASDDSRQVGGDTEKICVICGATEVKYTCPGCMRRTCGLECVRGMGVWWGFVCCLLYDLE